MVARVDEVNLMFLVSSLSNALDFYRALYRCKFGCDNQNGKHVDELGSVLRDQAFDDIGRVSELAGSYARSAAEAAYRGDAATVGVHLKQLRLCCLSLIKTYKDHIDGDGISASGPAHDNGADQRPGNGGA